MTVTAELHTNLHIRITMQLYKSVAMFPKFLKAELIFVEKKKNSSVYLTSVLLLVKSLPILLSVVSSLLLYTHPTHLSASFYLHLCHKIHLIYNCIN